MSHSEEIASQLGNLKQVSEELGIFPIRSWVPNEDKRFVKRCVLIGSSIRLSNMVRAITIMVRAITIMSEQGFDEEVSALSRMLVEVAVNACYLQVADESEMRSFLHFDQQYSLKQLQRSAYAAQDAETREERDAKLLQLRTKTGLKDDALSWSSNGLKRRAKLAEAVVGAPVLESIVANIIALSNFSVHGTLLSLATSMIEVAELDRKEYLRSRAQYHLLALKFSQLAITAFTHAFANTLKADAAMI